MIFSKEAINGCSLIVVVVVEKSDTSGIRTHARRLVPKTSALDHSAIVSTKSYQLAHHITKHVKNAHCKASSIRVASVG
jgi:hypothetical protein